ncbi:MAG TPA: septum site-determining protein MinC [Tissierellaceae bacterium]|jgi:septum site-determining protein MinC|nr:septum site-determining protein MinC [Tissierellaceae bacterium]
MRKDVVSIKGVAGGIYLNVEGNDLGQIKTELESKMKTASNFFKGSKFLGVRGEDLTEENRVEIMLLLKYKYDFEIQIEKVPDHVVKDNYEPVKEMIAAEPEVVQEGMTKFVHGTLRSGQEVSYNGNIVVIGDVNPGALLKAKGNIVVLGSLRGVAQAGIGGNRHAVVAAYSLLPTQLRIADYIVRPPEDDIQYKYPEIARVVDGAVVIEPYLPNK